MTHMQVTHIAAILIALDAISTFVVLRKGGVELNRLLRWLIERIGAVPALLVSHAATVALIYYVLFPTYYIWGVIAFYSLLLVNNLLVLRKLISNPPA